MKLQKYIKIKTKKKRYFSRYFSRGSFVIFIEFELIQKVFL